MRVLLTHSEGRLEGLAAALEVRGFSVTHHPLVETEFLTGVYASAQTLLSSDWLLFTSRTAVQAWAALGLPLTGHVPKLGVVGEATAREVELLGAEVTLTAEPANAQGLLRTFRARVTPPASVGLPCAEQALPTLSTGLARAGFDVNKVWIYKTVPQPFSATTADIIVLASPTAVSALRDELNDKMRLIALGPSTYRAVRERGWRATEARTPDLSGVVQAVLDAAPLAL